MNRFIVLLLVSTAVLASACREKAQAPANATASPQPSVNAAAAPQAAGSINPNQAFAVPGQQPKSLNDIPERLRRPLTLEEIKQLPPESRDMILKAIGQPVPSASPAKKK